MEVKPGISLIIKKISTESEEFKKIFNEWSEEIEHYFPNFSVHDITFSTVFWLLVNDESAGIVICQGKGEELHIDVDYLIPKYRNNGVGKTFFDAKLNDFKKFGFEVIITVTDVQKHKDYVTDIGFVPSNIDEAMFEMNLR